MKKFYSIKNYDLFKSDKNILGKLIKTVFLTILIFSVGSLPVNACTITITNKTQTYDGTPKSVKVSLDFTGTYTIKYKPEGSSTTNYTINAPTNAGRYNVLVTIISGNYKGQTKCDILTINRATICGIAFNSRTYEFSNSIKTLTINGTLPTGTSVAYTNNSRTNSGISNATATISGTNYNTLKLSADLTITPKPITVTATAQTKIYGSVEPMPTYTTSFNISTLGGTMSGSMSRIAGENVGSYDYTVGTLTAGCNFSICFVPNPLIITKKPLSISGISADSKVYDGTTIATLRGTALLEGIIGQDNITITTTIAVFNSPNAANNIPILTTFTISGVASSNYTVIQPILYGTITKAPLTITFPKVTKIYDGNTTASVPLLTVLGAQNNESISAKANLATFDNKNVGQAKQVTLNGISFISPNNSNYTLDATASNNLGEIYAKDLSATLKITHPSIHKIFDGTLEVASIPKGNFIINGIENGDDVTVSGYSSAAYSTIHVGDNKEIKIDGFTFSGDDINNYILPTSTTSTSNSIGKKNITITVNEGQTKVYDQNSTFPSHYTYNATILPNGDSYSGSLARSIGENVNIYPINLGTLTPNTEGELTPGSNYEINFIGANFTITPKPATLSGVVVATKIYDATTLATLTNGVLDGILTLDNIDYTYAANFSTKNAGTDITVNATFGLIGENASNYTLTAPTTLQGSITPRELTAVGFSIADKAADGTNLATIGNWGSLQIVPTEDLGKVSIKQSGVSANFLDTQAGANKPVSITTLQLEGSESNNYTLKQPESLTASINTSPAIFSWNTPLTTTYNGQEYVVNITETHNSNLTITFADSNGNPISGNPINAGAYTVSVVSNSTTFTGSQTKTLTILPKNLGYASFANGEKEYDATTDVTPQPTINLVAIEARDIYKVEATGAPAKYDSPNVGQRTVTITNIALVGERKDNYLINPIATNNNWKITKRPYSTGDVKVTFDYQEKVFDGNTSVLPSGINTPIKITGLLANDAFTASANYASYNSATAGIGNKTVTLSNIQYLGNDALNYELPTAITNDTCTILPLDILNSPTAKLSFSNQTKVYDGTTNVLPIAVPSITITGLVSNYTNVSIEGAMAYYDNKNVGENKTVTISGISVSGKDASNYIFPNSVQNFMSSITPRSVSHDSRLKVTFASQSKFYDATTNVIDSITGTPYIPKITIEGILAGDDVLASGTTAQYDTKNVGLNNKTVTINNINYSGTDALNYQLPNITTNTTCTITPKPIGSQAWLEFANQTKVYDGTKTVKSNGIITIPSIVVKGLLGTDMVTAIGQSASYDTKNVGQNKRITIKGITIGGSDKNNYLLPDSAINNSSTIVPKSHINDNTLNVTFANQSKSYDGMTKVLPDSTATTLIIAGLIQGDTVNGKAANAFYDTKDAGTSKQVTLSGITYSGVDALNYILPSIATNNNCIILPLQTSEIDGFMMSFAPQTKLYDGTISVKENGIEKIPTINISGLPFGDVVSATASIALYDDKNVKFEKDGSGKIKTVTLSNIKYSGAAKDNYIFPATLQNDQSIINPVDATTLPGFKVVFNNVIKEYDGNRNATITNLIIDNGLYVGDNVSIASSDSARFDDKNVGIGKTVTAYGLQYQGSDVQNYILPTVTTNTESEIYKRGVNTGGLTLRIAACTKVFDGTRKVLPDSTKTHIYIDGLLSNDQATALATTATYDNPNVGYSNKTVTLNGLIFTGKDAGNYHFPTSVTNDSSSITPLLITDIEGARIFFANQTKVYDGTTKVMPLAVPEITIYGLLPGTVVTAKGSSASYDNKNVGVNKTVTIRGIKGDGKDAKNYILPDSILNYNSTITPRGITHDSNLKIEFSEQSKVYDGTREVLDPSSTLPYIPSLSITGLIAGDKVTARGTLATYDSKNVGINIKTVTVSGITLSGADSQNYQLPTVALNTKSTIRPLVAGSSLKLVIGTQSKVYDGTTIVKFNGVAKIPVINIVGLIPGDIVTATGSTANYNTKHAGINKIVTVKGVVFGGIDRGNYLFPDTVMNTTSIITPRSVSEDSNLSLSFANQTKIYDGTTKVLPDSTKTVIKINGLLGNDQVLAKANSATYDTKNVGTSKTVTLSGIQFSGLDANNYLLPTTVKNSNCAISPLAITYSNGSITFAPQTKIYDGTTIVKSNGVATIPAITISNLPFGDIITATATSATYDNKNVKTTADVNGKIKTVTLSGIQYNGVSKDNYILPSTLQNDQSIIEPLDLTNTPNFKVTFDKVVKEYDATTNATATNLKIESTILNGDNITLAGHNSASFDNKNVGINKTVTAIGITYGGADALNYQLPTTATNNNSEIYKFGAITGGLAVDFEQCTKTYDASTTVKIAGITQIPTLRISGLKAGDELNITATKAAYDDKNAKINKVVTLSELQITGKDAANYNIPASYSTSNNIIEKLDLRGRSGLTATALAKVYDGTKSIPTIPAVRILNLFKDDVVSFTGSSAIYDGPDVSSNRSITISGVIGSGRDFDNYIFDTEFTISNCSITRKPVSVSPDENQSRLYDDTPVDITYQIAPATLPNGTPITLNGKASFNWDREVGAYPIELGTIGDDNNPNYSVSLLKSAVNYTITTDVFIVKKYGNTLLVNNYGDYFSEYQWYKDGKAINGATAQFYNNPEKTLCGLYSCEVTRISKGTRVKTARQYEEVNCGGTKSFAIYPNLLKPCGTIKLEMVSGGSESEENPSPIIVQIFSMGGEIVKTHLVFDEQLSLIEAPTTLGVYIVKVTQGEEIIATEKIIIK